MDPTKATDSGYDIGDNEFNIGKADFAYVDKDGRGHLPIHDAAHVRAAMARFDQTDFPDSDAKRKAAKKIIARARKLSIEVADDSAAAMAAKETKAMGESDGPSGGYLVPPDEPDEDDSGTIAHPHDVVMHVHSHEMGDGKAALTHTHPHGHTGADGHDSAEHLMQHKLLGLTAQPGANATTERAGPTTGGERDLGMPKSATKQYALKVLTDDDRGITFGQYGIVWGGKDLVGDTFKTTTDLWLKHLGPTWPMLYEHGKHEKFKRHVFGKATTEEPDTVGVFVKGELSRQDEYFDYVAPLIRDGALGWSSGAIDYLIERAPGGELKSWPVGEWSLTVTPCEPRTLGVKELTSLAELSPQIKSLLPTEDPVQGSSNGAGASLVTFPAAPVRDSTQGKDEPMPAELDTLNASVKALQDGQTALSTMIEKLMKQMEDAPPLKNAGFYTQDGGKADPQIKNFGDYLLAIKRGDVTRLNTVYKSFKTLNESNGQAGGYLVPPEYRTDLLQVSTTASDIVAQVQQIPVSSDAGVWPALDQYVAPTAGGGDTAFAAGVKATRKAEGAELDTTEPTFDELNWKIQKIGGVTYVSNELNADSPQAIETLLRMLFGVAISAKREYYILRGNGVDGPLGILNAAALTDVTKSDASKFSYKDAVGMIAKAKIVVPSKVRWIMHPGVLVDFADAVWVQGTVLIKLTDLGYGGPTLSEHMPQHTNNGDVLLADLSTYLLFVRQELSIAFSEHAAFTSDRGVWRFLERLDGQPWLRKAITLADPQGGYTVSSYVRHFYS